ncbi:universal stress protein [Amycolatopsis sp. NPDC059021]|uniref:universal stress protein n=1 Tax=Amycolatopsis sp. NPDC059021 TaxID=3346704 RepID=UPI003670FB29
MRPASERAVVVGIDGSESARLAAVWGAEEAVRRGLPLRLVSVYTVPRVGLGSLTGSVEAIRDGLEAQARVRLETASKSVRALYPHRPVELAAREWNPVAALTQESERASLVVLGSRGLGGFTGLLVGSTAVALAGHGHCPVVVVRGRTPNTPPPVTGPVVVGLDGSADSVSALAFACEEASWRRARLVAVHTWNPALADGKPRPHPLDLDPAEVDREERRVLAEQLAGWQEKYPEIAIDRVVACGRPVRTLLDRADRAQLLVVGSRGLGGFRGMMLGSTSQAVLAHSPCPVAVIRQTGEGL